MLNNYLNDSAATLVERFPGEEDRAWAETVIHLLKKRYSMADHWTTGGKEFNYIDIRIGKKRIDQTSGWPVFYIRQEKRNGPVSLLVNRLTHATGEFQELKISDAPTDIQIESWLERLDLNEEGVSRLKGAGRSPVEYSANERGAIEPDPINESEASLAELSTTRTLPSATNLILYGPPGTGKTYSTAAEAVRLCLGDGEAAPLLEPDERTALMKKYRELVEAGRIDFVTFHQSYSYEDFVEGLRPTTDAEDVPAELDEEIVSLASGGFRLRSEDGIFKVICERARIDRGDKQDDVRLDRHRRIFKMSLGRRGIEEDRINEGLQNNLVHLGWGGDIDWSGERFESFDEIKREWNDKKDASASGKDSNIEMIYSLRCDMRIGDYVVLSDGRDAIRALGKVTGEYYYDADAPYHPHRRNVDWLWQDVNGAQREIFYNKYFRQHSIYRLRPDTIDWDGLEKLVLGKAALQAAGGARPYVLIIDEINRANISKVFGELITLLEPDKRLGEVNEIKVKLPYSDGPAFGVPANLHIIGTMNTADRSIALLDTALRRRFTFRELMPQPALLKPVDDIDLAVVLTTLNERIEYLFDREHQIGHAYFIGCEARAQLDEVMRHKVIPLLAEYFYEDWNKVAAVLGDANDGEGDYAGGFLDRKKLACPRGMGGDGDAPARFRWSVRAQFDFANLVR